MINVITRSSIGKELFESIIEDNYDTSSQEHRRNSNFYTRWIFEVNAENFPDYPELFGFWESNDFIFDSEHGVERDEIDELVRVEKKTKTVITEEWVAVE